MRFTPNKTFAKKTSKSVKKFHKKKIVITLSNDITGKLYTLDLLGKKDRETYEKNALCETMYENLLIIQTTKHDEKKRNKILDIIKNLDNATFVHFCYIHDVLVKSDECARVIESVHVNKICALYSYIGFKISFKYHLYTYSGLYEITIKPN